jgi:hypothetical protein
MSEFHFDAAEKGVGILLLPGKKSGYLLFPSHIPFHFGINPGIHGAPASCIISCSQRRLVSSPVLREGRSASRGS